MKQLIIFLILLTVVSCASENQQRGLEIIGSHYNTKTSFSKGFNTNVGKTMTKFTINVEGSPLLDTLHTNLVSSNVALMLYENFTEDERDKYTYIEVAFKKDSLGEAGTKLYEPSVLDDGLDQSAIFTNFSDNLLAKNYGAIAENVEPEYQNPKLASNLGAFMKTLHDEHGGIVEYKRLGFGEYTKSNGEKLFQFSGHLTFSDGYINPYFITTSKDVKNNFISGYRLN